MAAESATVGSNSSRSSADARSGEAATGATAISASVTDVDDGDGGRREQEEENKKDKQAVVVARSDDSSSTKEITENQQEKSNREGGADTSRGDSDSRGGNNSSTSRRRPRPTAEVTSSTSPTASVSSTAGSDSSTTLSSNSRRRSHIRSPNARTNDDKKKKNGGGDDISVSSYRSSVSMRSSASARSRNAPSGMEERMRKRAGLRTNRPSNAGTAGVGGNQPASTLASSLSPSHPGSNNNTKKNAVAAVSSATVAARRHHHHHHQHLHAPSSSRSVSSSSSSSSAAPQHQQPSMLKDEITKLRREKIELQQAHEVRIQQLEKELATFRHHQKSANNNNNTKNDKKTKKIRSGAAIIIKDGTHIENDEGVDGDNSSKGSTDTEDTGDGTAVINNTTIATVEKLTTEQEELKQQLQEAQNRIKELEAAAIPVNDQQPSQAELIDQEITVEQLKTSPSTNNHRDGDGGRLNISSSSMSTSSGERTPRSLSPTRSARLEQLRSSRKSREVQLKELVQEQQNHQQHAHTNAPSNPVDVTDIAKVIVNLKDELMAAHEVIRQQRTQLENAVDSQIQNQNHTNEQLSGGSIGQISSAQAAGEHGGVENTDLPELSYNRDAVPGDKFRKLQEKYSQLQVDRAWGEFRLRDRITDDALKFHRRLKHWKDECNKLQSTMKDLSEQHMEQLVEVKAQLQMYQEKARLSEDDLQDMKRHTKSITEQLLQAQEKIAMLENELESKTSVKILQTDEDTKRKNDDIKSTNDEITSNPETSTKTSLDSKSTRSRRTKSTKKLAATDHNTGGDDDDKFSKNTKTNENDTAMEEQEPHVEGSRDTSSSSKQQSSSSSSSWVNGWTSMKGRFLSPSSSSDTHDTSSIDTGKSKNNENETEKKSADSVLES